MLITFDPRRVISPHFGIILIYCRAGTYKKKYRLWLELRKSIFSWIPPSTRASAVDLVSSMFIGYIRILYLVISTNHNVKARIPRTQRKSHHVDKQLQVKVLRAAAVTWRALGKGHSQDKKLPYGILGSTPQIMVNIRSGVLICVFLYFKNRGERPRRIEASKYKFMPQ